VRTPEPTKTEDVAHADEPINLDIDELLGTDEPEIAVEIETEIAESTPVANETLASEYTHTETAFMGPEEEGAVKDITHSPGQYIEQLKQARAAREAEFAQKQATLDAKNKASANNGTGINQDVEWVDVEVKPGVTIKQRNTDGAYLIGERFLVYGDGSKEKPYELTWEMLYSVRETYRPRKGLDEIPAWATWLDGEHVRITGFMATAVFAEDVDELLVMKNEWDGCCIGVPPTPYDAVEVRLSERIKLTAGMMSFGTLNGRLEVEPYLVRNWLVGLYLLEDAKVESSGF